MLAMVMVVFPQLLVRRVFSVLSLVSGGLLLGMIIGINLKPWYVPLVLSGIYQLINTARIVENRMHLSYLRAHVWRSGLWMLLINTVLALAADIGEDWVSVSSTLYIAHATLAVAVSAVFLGYTYRSIRSTRTTEPKKHFSDADLPTVSVLISARNEDSALNESIHTLLKSDYPKLEIIVLDDCSQDRSSDIIKSYAHRGVRFIQGEEPSDDWLAKNQAYHVLSEAASGEWLLFMSVDVRLEPAAIRHLITHALNRKLRMVSVLPRRVNQSIASNIFSPLRNFWELAVPPDFRVHKRYPVLSTIWAIEKQVITKNGGFAPVSRSVSPEGYLARKSGAYQFVRSSEPIGVSTSKPLSELYRTAIRIYYPEMSKEVHRVFFSTYLGLLGLVVPFIAIIPAFITGHILAGTGYALACLLLLISHLMVITVTNPQSWAVGLFNLPLALIQEFVILNISMYRYEFTEIFWKGRNICYPVMHVTTHLPREEGSPTRSKLHS